MDSFTQIALGVAISNATLGKKLGNTSIIYGVLFGTLPDLDIFIGKVFFDPVTANEIHRGFSHSIAFFMLCSLIFAFFSTKWHKEIEYRESFIGIFLILLTHSLLDIFTTWGTQLFWPLSDKIALNSIFVIDPLYTLPLTICTIWSLTISKNSKKRFWVNYFGIIISSSYLIYGLYIQSLIKNEVINQFPFHSATISDSITVKPTAFNSILWNIIIQDETGFYLTDYSLMDSKPLDYHFYPRNEYLIKDIRNESIIHQLKSISENQYTITKHRDSLFFNDLRFGLLSKEKEQFAFSYYLFEDKNKQWSAKEQPKSKRDGKKLLRDLWTRLKGN